MDPNALLDDAAPRVADASPVLQLLLDEMVLVSRPTPRRRRRRRLAVVSGAVAATAALGVASAAAAAVVMHYTTDNVPDATESATFSWTTAAGNACKLTVQAGPRADSDPRYSGSQQAALEAVHDWSASFDIGAVDIATAEKSWLRSMHERQVNHPSMAELAREFRGDELEKYAVGDAAETSLSGYLADRGFSLRSLNAGYGLECDG